MMDTETKTETGNDPVSQKMITVVVVEPDKSPEKRTIPATLKEMQSIVGGLIEEICPFHDDEVAIICNEEGKINGLPLNRALIDDDGDMYDVIAGTFFITYAPRNSENFESLPDNLAERYINYFKYPEFFCPEERLAAN